MSEAECWMCAASGRSVVKTRDQVEVKLMNRMSEVAVLK